MLKCDSLYPVKLEKKNDTSNTGILMCSVKLRQARWGSWLTMRPKYFSWHQFTIDNGFLSNPNWDPMDTKNSMCLWKEHWTGSKNQCSLHVHNIPFAALISWWHVHSLYKKIRQWIYCQFTFSIRSQFPALCCHLKIPRGCFAFPSFLFGRLFLLDDLRYFQSAHEASNWYGVLCGKCTSVRWTKNTIKFSDMMRCHQSS